MSDINIQTFSGKVSVKNDLRVGQGHLFVDTAANQVGLNSLTPQANLHVTGNTYVTSDLRVGSGIVMDQKVATFGTTKTFVVEVVGGVFEIDGVSRPALTFHESQTYIFDQSHNSNGGHPIAFSEAVNGGTPYTTGVTSTGTPGQAGAQTTFKVPVGAPSTLYYYCTQHPSTMGSLSSAPSVVRTDAEIIVSGRLLASSFHGDGANLNNIPASAINGTLSQWVTTGNDIYYSTGGVAIGSSQAPTSTLDVTGSGAFSTTLSVGGSGTFGGDLTVGTDKLFVDVSTGQVGVGTTTPAAGKALDVVGDFQATYLYGDGSNISNITSSQWVTTGTDIYYNTGSVAIGSSQAPTSTLDVTGTGAFSDDVTVGTSKLVVDVSASRVGVNKATPGYTLDVDGDINFTGNLTQNGSAYGGGSGSGGGGVWTEITGTTTDIHYSSGNVGIANSSPQHTLSVGSNLYVEDAGSNVLVVDGNVACTQLTLGQFEIVPSYGLGDVTAESNVTTDTVELNNATTGLSTVSNVVVGGELTVSGNAAVSSNLTVSGNAAVSSNLTVTGNATVSSNLTVSGFVGTSETGAITVPTGTTVQQPTGVAGMIRFNTEISELEYYTPLESSSPAVTGGTITSITGGETSTDTQVRYKIHEFTSGNDNLTVSTGPVLIEYLIIGGGGGGGINHGGGGGGGGYITGTMKLLAGTYPIVIGAGGNGGTYINNAYIHSTNGGNSSAFGLTAYGGGGGGGRDNTYNTGASTATLGIHGASGGGGAGTGYAQADTTTRGGMNKIYPNEWKPVINDHSIQGNAGGYGSSSTNSVNAGNGGGGGGAGGGGQNATGQSSGAGKPGDGGVGKFSGITGDWIERAGGGGGGRWQSGTGSSASGGGGAGGNNDSVAGTAGTSGTGGGGGGGGGNLAAGGNGGSGIVIVRYKV